MMPGIRESLETGMGPAHPRLASGAPALVAVIAILLLAGCAVAPQYEMPDGIVDPKHELVERIREAPGDLAAHADLLRLQIRDGDELGAAATVHHALRHNGTDFRAHLLAAQYHRWQADLISAERSLLTARDMAPQRLEPRVALSGLYHQAYLEDEELEQRRVAYELADASFREEFLLDYAWAAAQLGRDEQAVELANELLNSSPSREYESRAHVLLSELALRAGDEGAAVDHLLKARRMRPREDGLVQFAARLVSAVEDGSKLAPLFDETLATQDTPEARWAALFGKWMLAVREGDPLRPEADIWFERLESVAAGHPDTLTRRYQLLSLNEERAEEAAEARAVLEGSEFGVPDTPRNLAGLLRLWRAEDALRIGAAGIALTELVQLEAREPQMTGLPVMRLIALFRAREDERCIAGIEAWQQEATEPDQFLASMRWWVMLRSGQSRQVLVEVEKSTPSNATIWIEAVAKFHMYRASTPE
jgi:hypothetical protein